MGCSHVLTSVLMVGQVAVAGAIIALVVSKMQSVNLNVDVAHFNADVTNTCLLGQTDKGVNLCYVAYGFSGVSIAATAALSLLLCCTCNLCGVGSVLDTVFSLAGAAWWAMAGVIFNFYFKQPSVAALPQAEVRGWIIILCWVGCGFFAAAFLVNLSHILAKCCSCCARCCGDDGTRARDLEAGGRGRGQKAAPPRASRTGQGQFIAQDIAPTAYYKPNGGR